MESKKETLERKDLPQELKWDLESMYKDVSEWEKDYNKAKEMAKSFDSHKDKAVSSSENLYNTLKDKDELYRLASNLYSYTHMKLDVDTRDG